MKKYTRIISIVTVAVLLCVFWLFQSGFFEKKETPKSAKTENEIVPTSTNSNAQPSGIPVKAFRITPAELNDYITVNGATFPAEEAAISSEISGKIEKILFQEGTYIKVGTPLVEIRNTELAAERQRLVVQQQLAQKIAGRLEGLYAKEGVSLQEVDIAQAEVATYAAEIALLDARLEKTIVKAPFSGKLGLKKVSVGSYVMPGTPIVHLVQMNPIKLQFSIPEKYVGEIQNGAKVKFKMAGSDEQFIATVIASNPMIDAATRTLTLQATAPNSGAKILPGTFASVRVNLGDYDEAVMVPTQSIVPEIDGKKVYKYEAGKVVPIAVETGIRRDASIQVKQGVAVGDTILTTGLLQVRSGSEVYISEMTD